MIIRYFIDVILDLDKYMFWYVQFSIEFGERIYCKWPHVQQRGLESGIFGIPSETQLSWL